MFFTNESPTNQCLFDGSYNLDNDPFACATLESVTNA